MKYIFLLIAFLGITIQAQAQCNCKQEFAKIKNHIEQNYAGFKDKVTNETLQEYKQFTEEKEKLVAQAQNKSECYFITNQWLSFFNDGHLYTGVNIESFKKSDKKKLQMDFPTETIEISSSKLKALEKSKGIEGIYVGGNQGFSIAIIGNKTPVRDFVGVVINSEDSKIKNGTVLIELKEKKKDEFFMLGHSSNNIVSFKTLKFKNGELINGFVKKGYKIIDNTNDNFEAKLLDKNTLYINIPSFSWEAKSMVDSLFASQKENLEKTTHLILDLRNNGGGSDDVYYTISPYLYTQPVKSIGVNMWASEDNIKGWEKMLEDPKIPAETKAEYQKIVANLKQHKNENVNMAEDYIDSDYTPMLFPKNVVILINEGCASSTEQFLLEAKQSKKVTLMGQNTSGTLDYSNLRESDFCEMPYSLWMPTTRSRRIDIGEGIDGIGIKPSVYLTEKQDWVKEAVKYLSGK